MAADPDRRARARDRVLFELKSRGAQTAAQLARHLDVTPMAVRQHLAALQEEGLVSHFEERHKIGRPARVWDLTPASSERFPDTHADLTVELLGAMRDTFGDAGLDKMLAVRARHQLASYRARMPRDASPARRVAALAALRREEGYMASSCKDGDTGFLLIENHCPICAAAATCQGLCRDELGLFRKLLGPELQVERVEHILSGARRCSYKVTPRAPKQAPRGRGA